MLGNGLPLTCHRLLRWRIAMSKFCLCFSHLKRCEPNLLLRNVGLPWSLTSCIVSSQPHIWNGSAAGITHAFREGQSSMWPVMMKPWTCLYTCKNPPTNLKLWPFCRLNFWWSHLIFVSMSILRGRHTHGMSMLFPTFPSPSHPH